MSRQVMYPTFFSELSHNRIDPWKTRLTLIKNIKEKKKEGKRKRKGMKGRKKERKENYANVEGKKKRKILSIARLILRITSLPTNVKRIVNIVNK